MRFHLLFSVIGVALSSTPPSGLLCDFQKQPALGVRAVPRFTWIVPPCALGSDHQQTAYQINVVADDGQQIWDSGKIASNASTYVAYAGPALKAGAQYRWTVATWTSPAQSLGTNSCQSPPSAPATLVTSLFGGWNSSAQWMGLGGELAVRKSNSPTFGYFRKDIEIPSGVVSASAFVTAEVDGPLLSGYKLYINGSLVNVGPGRGEAPVWDGDGTFRSLPYTTLDVTSYFSSPGSTALALQTMHSKPAVIMQINLKLKSGVTVTIATDATWMAFNGDVHRNPGPPQHGFSAGTGFLEYIDASFEPIGWKLLGFKGGASWTPASASASTPSQVANLHAKMGRPMQVKSITAHSIRPVAPSPGPSYVVDFGREFQGGLKLSVEDGKRGQTVHIACGESLSGDTVGSTWGWEFDWKLRDGAQVLEQHKYMECRFVSLAFPDGAPSNFTLSAWQVHYEWDDADTHFESSNETLNAVWELMRYTLEGASLDTYTDSNTRERRPYEADGGIAATSRLMLQREYMWGRHSHAWTIQNPTWPVEWQQLTPFLGWQDYMATGQTDLAEAFLEQMYDRSMIKYLDDSGLLDTSKMGHHIVDWMPNGQESDQTVALGEFTASNHTSVSNGFCVHGLELLSKMAAVAGLKDNATAIAAKAASLKQAMIAKMWNGTAFCDGVCDEVEGHSLVMTNIFTLFFGMVPEEHVASAWQTVADWGLENMGDYGAFMYLNALSSGYYAPLYSTPDDGSAVVKALTKCDHFSWCSGLRDDNLTMTRESWHDGTYSHPWGTGAVVGVVEGLMGVHPTAPGFATFTVKPKLGPISHAAITVPSLRGHIKVTAAPGLVKVDVPCNTFATLCLPRSSKDSFTAMSSEMNVLLLDGDEVSSTEDGGHLCAQNLVSCGKDGASRMLASRPRVTEIAI